MIIGKRLRALREEKNYSQGDIEKRTGMLRAYVSRVENGHTIPSVESLEKFAKALEVPMYQLFYDGEEPPDLRNLPKTAANGSDWGASGKDARMLARFCELFSHMDEDDEKLVLHVARKMAGR